MSCSAPGRSRIHSVMHPLREHAARRPGRWSRRRWHGRRCRAAGRSRPDAGRRCGRRRSVISKVSPARCGRVRMLELSPLVTAASASACSRRLRSRWSRSKPNPDDLQPAPVRGRSDGSDLGSLSMMATEWPSSVELDCEPRTDPPATDDDDMHGDHRTRWQSSAQLTGRSWPGRRGPSGSVVVPSGAGTTAGCQLDQADCRGAGLGRRRVWRDARRGSPPPPPATSYSPESLPTA